MSTLLPVADALAQVLAAAVTTGATSEATLIDALGTVLAEDVIATIAVPGHDNSAMDGYALRAADATGPLPVSQRIAAGSAAASAELA
ncbi:MAG: molybdopterin molybdenumtransferase MoeA, partial [Halieaceae bacterium]|nr:molybdopterin molybdenumtransferase MoeA [Halieaceae bacterium]